jgi:hypothetical protein
MSLLEQSMLAEMIATSSALGATDFVIAGLDPAIQWRGEAAWMRGSSPRMTTLR